MNGNFASRNALNKDVPRARLPTVDEALQYSPLTSVVPFSSDIIPFPCVLPSPVILSLTNKTELDLARSILRPLNAHPSNPYANPQQLRETIRDLQGLLGKDDVLHIKFKKRLAPARFSSRKADYDKLLQNSVQSFPSLLLESTDIIYQYESSASSPKKVRNHSHHPTRDHKETPSLGRATIPCVVSSHVFKGVVQAQPQPPAPNGSKAHTQSSPLKPAVVVPDLPPSSDPRQYEKYPEVDAAIIQSNAAHTLTQKRENENLGGRNEAAGGAQEHSDAIVSKFQDFLIKILEAEDLLACGGFTAVTEDVHKYFFHESSTNPEHPLLLPEVMSRLERALTVVIEAHRLRDTIPDHLSRLQKLCAASLTLNLEQNLILPETSQDDSYNSWFQSIQYAENSLCASKLLLKMISADEQERLLFSEEILQLVLNNLKHVLDSCVIPVTEKRMAASEKTIYQSSGEHLRSLALLFQRVGGVLRLLGNVILRFDLSETSITVIEFLATRLIFIENSPSEKDSLIGIQKFETVRRHAMDVVAKVFLRYPEHRRFLIDEILTSLEKLPVTRQNARHFKIKDGKPIQLVSALIMQLIQTSAVPFLKSSSSTVNRAVSETISMISEDELGEVSPSPRPTPLLQSAIEKSPRPVMHSDMGSITDVLRTAGPLFDGAQNNASYVVKYLVHRAMTSTKSGDLPYRNLLDIFTEDFICVLGSPDWPAAELLLRALLSNLIGVAENEKGSAPAKNMALDIMGTMGSGIADLRNLIHRTAQNVDSVKSAYGIMLPRICDEVLEGNTADLDIVKVDGVCRVAAVYYADVKSEDLQSQSSRDFFLVQWARNLCTAYDATTLKTTEISDKVFTRAAEWLFNAIKHPENVMHDKSLNSISASEIRICHNLNVVNMPFCSAFRRVIGILLTSLSSPHATVRSRSLKSVVQLLEQDATILDRFGNVLKHIVHSTSDPSPLVRDSALSLLGKCMTLKPRLESEICQALIAKTLDTTIGVRKRAMKLLKDVFVRNDNRELRANIADAILRRVKDQEETVVELALATIEDMWFRPFYDILPDTVLSPQAKHKIRHYTSHIIATMKQSLDIFSVLEDLMKALLMDGYKNVDPNREVSRHVIAAFFDDIIDNDATESNSQQNVLQVLTLFAKTCPQLFTSEQMLILRPYIENLSSADDLLVYRAVLVIYRCVLPVLPPLQHEFLRSVQTVLFNSIPRLKKLELEEVSACLWIIDGVLQNTERLVRLMLSVMEAIENAEKQDLTSTSKDIKIVFNKVLRYITIAGCFGKTCNLDTEKASFRERFSWWKGDSVSSLVVDLICPFSRRHQPLLIREAALESICLVCHANPASFIKHQVSTAISEALLDRNERLERVVLLGIKAFYHSEEERSKSGAEISAGEGMANGAERLGKSMILSDNDGATTSIAQQYLPHILRIALSTSDELALLATEVIASTNRQGLVHPKETGPALVALGTSPNALISKIALTELSNLHAKHESMLEKEYLNAVDQAFAYQKDTVRDVSGLDPQGFPKLRPFYEVLKVGSAGVRKKLLANLCLRIDIDLNKSRTAEHIDDHLLFVRFVLENLSLLDYLRMDELLHLLRCIEKIFAKSGNSLSHMIEASLNMQVETIPTRPVILPRNDEIISPHSLQDLTACSMILTMLWETRLYLRKAWSIQSLRDGKTKAAAKDGSRAPVRSGLVSADSHMEKLASIMRALDTDVAMMKQCQAFMYMFSVDNELKVGSGDDENNDGTTRYETPSEDADGDGDATPKLLPGSSKGTKRKGSISANSTPSKARKKGKPTLPPRKRMGSKGKEEEDDNEESWD